jgi:GT2 family glycosyltransferase
MQRKVRPGMTIWDQMKIAYVCTNYNNSSFTWTAIDSLMKNVGHEIEVFVVDNASQHDEVAKLRPLAQRYPSVHVIEHPNNIGYFRGLNVGHCARADRTSTG